MVFGTVHYTQLFFYPKDIFSLKQCKERLQKFTRKVGEGDKRSQTAVSSKYNHSLPIPTSIAG